MLNSELVVDMMSNEEIIKFLQDSERNVPLIKPKEDFIKKFFFSDPNKLILYAKDIVKTLISMKKYMDKIQDVDERLINLNNYYMLSSILRKIENCG